MAELMHCTFFNNNKKIKAKIVKTTIFVVQLDFLNFAPLMKVDDSICQKRRLFAGQVEFVTFAFKKAPVMENIG